MEALALEFKTNYPKNLYINLNILNGNAIKMNNYINIYKCHTKYFLRVSDELKLKHMKRKK